MIDLKGSFRAEQAKRSLSARAPVDIDRVCHPKQAKLVRAIIAGIGRGTMIAADCGRQSGKSHGGALAANLALLSVPNRNWIYVTSTYDSCRKMAFRPAVELNRTLALGGDPVDMEMRMPNGSVGYFMGADSERIIERLRGTPNLAGVIVDEAGLYRSGQLRRMIEVVKPGLRPLAGVLCVMGTPSPEGKQGTWYDMTVNPAIEQHRFDYRDNDRVPSFADVERLIDEELAMLFPALSPEARRKTAYFLREYMGEFVVDLVEKVYQLDEINLVDSIPDDLDTCLTGGDIGVSACDALVSLAWNSNRPGGIYVRDQEEKSGQDSIACAQMVKAHDAKRSPIEVAMDPGGLGQKTIMTVKNLYPGIPITEAQKPPIGVQTRHVNDLLQGARGWRLYVQRGSKLAMELSRPTWKGGIVGSEIDEHGTHSDLVPSLRYACIAVANKLADIPRELTPEEEARERYLAGIARAEKNARAQRSHGASAEHDDVQDWGADDIYDVGDE